jgi:hypothetical protein
MATTPSGSIPSSDPTFDFSHLDAHQACMSTPKSRLFERVEVFTRATTDALNKAISEVLDARSPWQLLYRPPSSRGWGSWATSSSSTASSQARWWGNSGLKCST